MKSTYEFRIFRSEKDKDLVKALSIYSKNIEPILRTDTREILYWLDNYNKSFKDKFYLVGFYLNNILVGFAQFVYFLEEKIIFVDYIVIDKDYRKNNTFYEFVEKIKDLINEEGLNYNYIIAEVGYFHKLEPTLNTKSLIRLLKLTGFGVVKADYYQPMLGKNFYESEVKSILMLYDPNEIESIKVETYISFVNTIYFNHYKRWYDRFFNEKEQMEYSNGLNKILQQTLSSIKKKKLIEINGYENIYFANTGSGLIKKYSRIAKISAILFLFSIFVILFGTLHIVVKSKFDIDTTAQSYIIIASIIAVFFIMSLIYEGKTQSLTSLMEKIINKFLG